MQSRVEPERLLRGVGDLEVGVEGVLGEGDGVVESEGRGEEGGDGWVGLQR